MWPCRKSNGLIEITLQIKRILYQVRRGHFIIVAESVEEDGDGQAEVLGTERAGRSQFCGKAVDGADRLESTVEDWFLKGAEQGARGGRPRRFGVVAGGERRLRGFDVRGGSAAVLVGARWTGQRRLAIKQGAEKKRFC